MRAAYSTDSACSALATAVAMVVTSWELSGIGAYLTPSPASSTVLSPSALRTLFSSVRS